MVSVSTALLISILLPIVSAVIVQIVGSDQAQWVRRVALVSSLLTLMLALRVVAGFDSAGD